MGLAYLRVLTGQVLQFVEGLWTRFWACFVWRIPPHCSSRDLWLEKRAGRYFQAGHPREAGSSRFQAQTKCSRMKCKWFRLGWPGGTHREAGKALCTEGWWKPGLVIKTIILCLLFHSVLEPNISDLLRGWRIPLPYQKPFAQSNDLLERPEGKIVPDHVVKSITKKSEHNKLHFNGQTWLMLACTGWTQTFLHSVIECRRPGIVSSFQTLGTRYCQTSKLYHTPYLKEVKEK